ncbi:MAG TPA: hypothetical protein VIG32_10070 [Candidatus Baltobacteraceae bacterium]
MLEQPFANVRASLSSEGISIAFDGQTVRRERGELRNNGLAACRSPVSRLILPNGIVVGALALKRKQQRN